MKQCPYCGEDIEESAKKCKYCNEWLEEMNCSFSSLNWKKIISPDFLKLAKKTISVVLLIVLLILGYNMYQSQDGVEEVTYRSITPVENSEYLANRYSARGLLDLIIRQEQDLKDYLSENHSRAKKTGLFMLYYKNLQIITDAVYNCFNNSCNYYGESDLDTGTTDRIANELLMTRLKNKRIIVEPMYFENSDSNNMADYFIIIDPKTDLLELIYVGEGGWGFEVNDSYLSKNYANNLNKSWKEYMHNKKRVCQDLNHSNYFDDGAIIPDGLTVAKWAVMWEHFIKKYPNFALLDNIKEDLEKYQSDILYRSYSTDYDEKTQKTFLRKDLRDGCEYYIKNGEKNTEIYNKIKRDYEIWKKNNFEYNKETEKLY